MNGARDPGRRISNRAENSDWFGVASNSAAMRARCWSSMIVSHTWPADVALGTPVISVQRAFVYT